MPVSNVFSVQRVCLILLAVFIGKNVKQPIFFFLNIIFTNFGGFDVFYGEVKYLKVSKDAVSSWTQMICSE